MSQFRSKPEIGANSLRQTRSTANSEDVLGQKDDALNNPHMPKYITNAPWYLNQDENSLSHQRAIEEKRKLGQEMKI